MKNQQSSPDAESSVVNLQPLAFKEVQDDGRVAIFQAKIPDIKMPDIATPILTVMVASPGEDKEAKEDLNEFLKEMRAGSTLTGAKADEDQSGGDPEPFNPADEILFTFGSPGPSSTEGAVGMTIVVETTVEETTVEESSNLRRLGSVRRNRAHRYVAPQIVSATVRSRRGSARIFPGPGNINTGGFYTVYARTITIRGITRCRYRLTGAVFTQLF